MSVSESSVSSSGNKKSRIPQSLYPIVQPLRKPTVLTPLLSLDAMLLVEWLTQRAFSTQTFESYPLMSLGSAQSESL